MQLLQPGCVGFKVKIGGLSLHDDMERLRVIREVIGYEKDGRMLADTPSCRQACNAALCKSLRISWSMSTAPGISKRLAKE